MSLIPLMTASLAIKIHVAAAVAAVCLGPLVLWRKRRDVWHKSMGYVWVSAMLVIALSSFGISSGPLPLGPIHILSFLTLAGLWRGITAIRNGQLADHQRTMRELYFWALGVAGLFAFIPGRIMNEVAFPEMPNIGFAVTAVLVSSGLAWRHFNARR